MVMPDIMRPESAGLAPQVWTRRQFLWGAGVAVAGLGAAGAARASTRDTRSLSFVHTHTGERLSAVYFQNGEYAPASLERINYLLRDFRTGDLHTIAPPVLDILYDLQTLADRAEPFEVICGYRSPKTNAGLRQHTTGVAEHSLHLEGRAIDVRLPGVPTKKLQQLALSMQRGGVGYYPASDFIHLDNGRFRYW